MTKPNNPPGPCWFSSCGPAFGYGKWFWNRLLHLIVSDNYGLSIRFQVNTKSSLVKKWPKLATHTKKRTIAPQIFSLSYWTFWTSLGCGNDSYILLPLGAIYGLRSRFLLGCQSDGKSYIDPCNLTKCLTSNMKFPIQYFFFGPVLEIYIYGNGFKIDTHLLHLTCLWSSVYGLRKPDVYLLDAKKSKKWPSHKKKKSMRFPLSDGMFEPVFGYVEMISNRLTYLIVSGNYGPRSRFLLFGC